MQITPPGGGAGSDTTAVHVGESTPGSISVDGLTVGGKTPVVLSPDTTQAGDIDVNGFIAAGSVYAQWGMVVPNQNPPSGFAAALSPDHGAWDGSHVPAGDHTYQLDATDATNGHTLPTDPLTVTIPADNIQTVLLTWTDMDVTNGGRPFNITLYRDGETLASLTGDATQYVDNGSAATTPSTAPSITDGSGGIWVQGKVLSHSRPVLEINAVGAVAAGTITPDKTITVYAADGTAYKIPAVLA